MEKLKTLLIIIATIFIGLVLVNVAFRVAVGGAMIALIAMFAGLGYVLSLIFRRRK